MRRQSRRFVKITLSKNPIQSNFVPVTLAPFGKSVYKVVAGGKFVRNSRILWVDGPSSRRIPGLAYASSKTRRKGLSRYTARPG